VALAGGCGGSSGHLPLRLVRDVPLAGGSGRFDYQSIDQRHRLLYIAHLAANEIVVYDLKRNAVARVLPGVASVHGVLAAPNLNRLYAAASGRHALLTFSETPTRLIAAARAGILPDGIAYDPRENETFVSDEIGDLEAVFDARSGRRKRFISLRGEPGNVQYDPVSGTVIVDVSEAGNLAVINPRSLRVARTIALPGCQHDHGLHLDPPHRLAFITCD
jgi:DNA-binding beta-propeller fold protein YncE